MKRLSAAIGMVLMISMVGAGCGRGGARTARPEVTAPEVMHVENAIQPIGVLSLHGGEATVTRGNVTTNAETDLELLPGDTIRVTTGTVMIAYPEAGASYLDPGTEVTLLPDGEGEGSVFAQIELAAGGIWTRFERLLGMDERFSVTGNGVVATVRGTAFGMEIVNGQADVQVADHEIELSVLEARRDVQLAKKTIRLATGEGMRVGGQAMMRMEEADMKKLVRKLSKIERERQGFKKMSERVPEALLKMKALKKMPGSPMIPERYRDRIDPTMLERLLQMMASSTAPDFIIPIRTP
jgi:hypothetical protein